MRMAYRRQGNRWSRAREVARSSFCIAFAVLSSGVFGRNAIVPPEHHSADWSWVVGFGAFSVFAAIAGLAAAARTIRIASLMIASLRHDQAQEAIPDPSACFAGRWYVPALTGASSLALLLGGLAMIATATLQLFQPGGNEDSAVIVAFLGLVALFSFYYLLGWFPLIRQPRDLLVVDEQGIRATWIDPPMIGWPEIEEIRVVPDPDNSACPDEDIVLFALHRPSPHWTSQVCVVDMGTQFGRSSAELLAILHAVRPATVPLFDPRRLDDGHRLPMSRWRRRQSRRRRTASVRSIVAGPNRAGYWCNRLWLQRS